MKLSDLPAAFRSVRRRNKYGAVPVVADGIRFDSQAEYRRWGVLKMLERAGKISALRVHPVYPLNVNGFCIGHYEPDFDYWEDGNGTIIEDVKGGRATQTPLWRWKRKHFEAQYRIKIRVVE